MHAAAQRTILLFLGLFFYQPVFSQQAHCYSTEKFVSLAQSNPDIYQRMLSMQQEAQQMMPNAKMDDAIYTIPVVVHVVYNTEAENIDDIEIFEQINILNEDFMRLNADSAETPGPFQGVAANCNIQFCLALFDPVDSATTGITRTHTDTGEWLLAFSDGVKFDETGGHDAWPANRYLNIWVCNLEEGVLGYAFPPGGDPAYDGIVVNYRFFGLGDISAAPYNLGRTATHEVGHWLGLNHIWGDDAGTCSQDDGIDDTPMQQGPTYGCPGFPFTDDCSPSSPGIMFMNYMDYTDDGCMNIFSEGQKAHMRGVLENQRGSLLNSPAGCNEIEPLPGNIAELIVYPVPTDGQFNVAINNFKGTANIMEIRVFDVMGHLIAEQFPEPSHYVSAYFDMQTVADGCYFIQAFNGTYFLTTAFIKN